MADPPAVSSTVPDAVERLAAAEQWATASASPAAWRKAYRQARDDAAAGRDVDEVVLIMFEQRRREPDTVPALAGYLHGLASTRPLVPRVVEPDPDPPSDSEPKPPRTKAQKRQATQQRIARALKREERERAAAAAAEAA